MSSSASKPRTNEQDNAGEVLLELTHVHKRYGATVALDSASLTLNAGSVHALVGENGAGKSTLIKLLAGIIQADDGQVTLAGLPVNISSPDQAFAHGLRFIHQELQVVPALSVAENIFLHQPYPNQFGRVRWRQLNRAATDVLAELGITHIRPNMTMSKLSAGDKMLVNIARTLLPHATGKPAQIFVMDEPTASLSASECKRLFTVIRRLKSQGCAVLYVSHRMDEIFNVCDAVTVLRDGRTVYAGTTDTTSQAELIQLMTGRSVSQHYPARETEVDEEVVLELQNATSKHVQNLNFTVQAGEIVGIAGLVGAGRSEVLRLVLGVDRLEHGHTIFNGKKLSTLSPQTAWMQGLAYIPEERRSQGLILGRSISDNVSLPHLTAMSKLATWLNPLLERQHAQTLGEHVRLRARDVQQKSRQLSGGNQQKVLFGRALAQHPKLLLLDEPTRGIDVAAKQDIYRLIREQSQRGVAVLMVSSELSELLGLCDKLVIMRDGQQQEVVPCNGLTEDALLSLCYGNSLSSAVA
ncbi:MAG: sugar ABC transporter ATP-binding protein [Deinococcota bacterium]